MRKIYLASVMMLLSALGSFAQVTTNSGSGLAATYPDLASAITALNAATITSPVVITLAGNETAPVGGYSITAQGTAANTIIIEGSASTITASAALVAGTLTDAIFKLVGADYVTLRNFTMQENAANTTTAAATNNMTEWGVALLYASTTNGAQNCTIQNNTITLNRTYQNTFGIYSNSTHSAAVPATSASATTTAGGNSGLKIYGNTISNVNNGVVVVGPTAAADYNTGVDIGGTGGADANTISNYGTTGTFSSYANVSGSVYGILIRNSTGYNIAYNSITSSAGGVTSGTLRGIYNVSATVAPTGTFTNTINNNTIALTYGVSSGTLQGITVEATNANATSVQNISNNNFTTLTASIASSVTITAISTVAPHLTVNINGNTFTNITTNTTGSFTFINHSYTMPAGGAQTISNNAIVTAFNKTGAGGTVTCTTTGTSSPNGTSHTTSNNNFSNITVTGATAIQGTLNNDGSGSSPSKTFTGNTYSNWTGGTSSITGITYNYIGGPISNFSNNTFSNITGQSTVSAIVIGNTFAGANPLNISSNIISNLTSTGTGAAVTGISSSNASTAVNINNNAISGLASTGASAVTGITVSGTTTISVYKNRICDLSGSNAGSTVNGILVSGGTTVTLSNNRIGDLKTPAANAANPLNGINITGGTTVNAYYNTVYLAGASSGALFGSSALSASTTPALTLNNNILYNNYGVTGAGLAVAYRRSSATLTTYGATSNNNDFNASTIYTDGVTPLATLAAYKALVGPTRDANSIAVVPSFTSTVCGDAGFLKINPAVATQLESGGANITGFADDFENDIRQGNAGYTGTGTAPDMGADEVEGTPAPSCSGTPASSTINGAATVCSGLGTTLTLSNPYLELGFTYQWASATTPGGPYTNLGTGNGQATGPLTVNTYYVCTITCANGGGTFTTPEKAVLVNALPTVAVNPATGSICTPGGSAIALTASGTALTYAWSPAAGLSGTTGTAVTALPASTTTYTVTGTDGNGCINTATSVITVSPAIIAVATATPAIVCTGANSQLNVTTNGLTGSIKITEVCLNRGGTGGGTYPAFAPGADMVEISNISGAPVDISGWVLTDHASNTAASTHTPFAFPSGTVIPANSVAVVCLGTGTDNIANRYYNTGGTSDTWLSSSLVGIVLKNGASVIDAVGCGSGYVFSAGTGVGAVDWSGFAPSASGLAGTTRTAANDNNTGADWIGSSTVAPQTIGVYNVGYTPPVTIASYAWSPSTFIAGQEGLQNPVATAVTATQAYSVLVTTSGGCTSTANVTVTPGSDATIITEPSSATRCIGNNAFFKVKAAGPALTYQWTKDGNPITNGGTIGGATTDSLFINGVVAGDAGVYSVIITPACGTSDTSSNVTLTPTSTKPTVPVTPGGPLSICSGTPQTLTASGTDAAAPSFTWLRNNVAISGAASPTYAVDTLGSFRVRVTDGVTGCFDTSVAVVATINPRPAAPTARSTAACAGSNVSLTSSAGGGYNMNPAGTETFIDIDANPTITSIASISDDSEHNIGIPQFTFNGIVYTTARVGMNGAIALGSTSGEITTANAALPSTANTAGNILLMPWWDDLDIATTGPATTIKLDTVGSKFIIQYTNTAHNDFLTGTVKFQVQMDTANGQIHFVYDDVVFGNAAQDNGVTATVGAQWANIAAAQYSFNTASLTAGQCISFTPAPLNYAWTGPNGFSSSLQNPVLSNVSSLDSGAYTVTFTNPVTGCINTASTTVSVIPADTFEWTGAVSTDWTNAANWFCGGVPTVNSKVIIRNGITNYPVVNLNVEIKSLTLRTGATVTVGTGFELKLNGN